MKNNKQRIYLAGPLFTWYDRDFNKRLARELRGVSYEVFVPQEFTENQDNFDSGVIYNSNKKGIEWADIILANLDGADADSGTAWECGYAKGIGKKVVCYRIDFRTAGSTERINLMVSESAEAYYEFLIGGIDKPFGFIAIKIISLLNGV